MSFKTCTWLTGVKNLFHGMSFDGEASPARVVAVRQRRDCDRAAHVLAMVFRRGMLTIGAGLAVGLPIAWGFARLMASLIFGVTANDAATFISIPLALIAAASLAIYIPARRATKIDPIVALRYE
jgi:hypothetical protein